MCGICGFLSFEAQSPAFLAQQLGKMVPLMKRRGPDDEASWDDGLRCALGFRRLSILDLSPTGRQPMLTPDERYVLVINGEVYNFRELRQELAQKGWGFRSTGDAEVVLFALVEWGVDALARFNGMFALALHDRQEKTLLLARDHAGIKPLFTLQTRQGVAFASQYDQLLGHAWSKGSAISEDALGLYLRLGYLPAPYAMLENTHALEPGTWLQVSAGGATRSGRFFEFPVFQTPDLHGPEAFEAVQAAVQNAVRRQMVSDVPIGAFLSGGIDSPLVTAEMQAASPSQITAFTIRTVDQRYDESPAASRYARHFGVQHVLEEARVQDVSSLLQQAVSACREPFADYSIFPTLLVSEAARKHIKVMLSGDGGDELFFGYAGRTGSVLVNCSDFRQPHWQRSLRWFAKRFLNLGSGYLNLRYPSIGAWYQVKHTHLGDSWLRQILPTAPMLPAQESLFAYTGWQPDETAQWLRWNEFSGHLTMILKKVDCASMYHSLEVRVPLLDLEVISTALRVDWHTSLDLSSQTGKIPLRQALKKHIPYQTQAKRGFSVPMDEWLRGPLRQVAEEKVMQRKALLGYPVNQQAAQALLNLHLQGQDHGWGLYLLLSLALWEDQVYACAVSAGS